jgi:RNA polymerase sigma-70 factor (ECF subfamily)
MMAHALRAAPLPFEPSSRWPRGLAVGLVFRRMTDPVENARLRFDELLVSVARERDRQAFEALFVYFGPRIKGYLFRIGARGALAEDLVQEAMLTVWRKAALFDPAKASAGTWIFTIARNLRVDAIRRERRPDFDPEDPAFVPEAEPAADEALTRRDDDERLRAAIVLLPPEQAEVVRLSFFADKPHSEIAKELGLPLGTVKSRLRLAMARIRAAMGDAS